MPSPHIFIIGMFLSFSISFMRLYRLAALPSETSLHFKNVVTSFAVVSSIHRTTIMMCFPLDLSVLSSIPTPVQGLVLTLTSTWFSSNWFKAARRWLNTSGLSYEAFPPIQRLCTSTHSCKHWRFSKLPYLWSNKLFSELILLPYFFKTGDRICWPGALDAIASLWSLLAKCFSMVLALKLSVPLTQGPSLPALSHNLQDIKSRPASYLSQDPYLVFQDSENFQPFFCCLLVPTTAAVSTSERVYSTDSSYDLPSNSLFSDLSSSMVSSLSWVSFCGFTAHQKFNNELWRLIFF